MMRRLIMLALVVAVGVLLAEHPRVREARRAIANTTVGHVRPSNQTTPPRS